ncbi:hypothetical protein [Streptomyces sp. NPDC054863]
MTGPSDASGPTDVTGETAVTDVTDVTDVTGVTEVTGEAEVIGTVDVAGALDTTGEAGRAAGMGAITGMPPGARDVRRGRTDAPRSETAVMSRTSAATPVGHASPRQGCTRRTPLLTECSPVNAMH